MRYLFLCILCTLLILKCDSRGLRVRRIVGGMPAEIPPPDDPVVFVKHNGKFARIEGTRNPNEYHYQFRGIRYAQAPIGKQRFQPPKAHTIEGIVDATKFPQPCLQPQPGTNNVIGSEDCLFLNVYTPLLPEGSEGLPVVLWIHGGGYRYGSASQYDVQNLVNKRVVLVTIQYRLGSLGFLSTGDLDLPGNAGLYDMALAVHWTRNYIGFFGGNPYQIVVMGQGSGGSSGLLLCLSNIAKGLTSGVVAMSGTAASNWAVDNEPKQFANEIAEKHGCPTNNVLIMISCLRALSATEIIKGDSIIESRNLRNRGYISGLSGRLTPYPVYEGRYDGRSLPGFIQKRPIQAMDSADVPNIPLLTGVNKDETQNAVNGQFRNEILNKVASMPNYLNQILVENLQKLITEEKIYDSAINQSKQITNILNPLEFKNYLTTGNFDVLSKISEATNDALFNLPAFLTANLWSKHNNSTYLYRFEHLGNSYKGYHFLKGLPIIGNSSQENMAGNFIGHGDELAYLFTPQNLDGSSLNIKLNETKEDKKVRTIFTDIIYNFVKNGQIVIEKKTIPPFTEKENNYIGISSEPKILNDFRFCQMGLWAGIKDRLQSVACNFLSTVGQGIQTVDNAFNGGVDKISGMNPFGSGIRKINFG